jgi:hypothetical protein
MSDTWIQKAINPSSKGKLRKALGVEGSKDIPAAKLEKATHSKNPTLKKEAVLAETLKGLRKR